MHRWSGGWVNAVSCRLILYIHVCPGTISGVNIFGDSVLDWMRGLVECKRSFPRGGVPRLQAGDFGGIAHIHHNIKPSLLPKQTHMHLLGEKIFEASKNYLAVVNTGTSKVLP